MQVTLRYAAEHLAELASAARRGEDIEIAQPDQPPIKLVVSTSAHRPRREFFGAWEGLVVAPTQEEWDRTHQQFLDEIPDFAKVDGGAA